MTTLRLGSGEHDIEQAAQLLIAGETVAFPTETVYGLGANALDVQAVDKIFAAKGRPSDNPLIVHIAQRAQLDQLVQQIPSAADKLMEAFWPGPLTLILPRREGVPDRVTAGLSTVAIRMPNHPVAQALITKSALPIAAPSANRSGRPSPTTASHVWEDLQGRIAAVVDGGSTGVGVESTVVDVTVQPPVILRPGGITKEMLEQVLGDVRLDPALVSGSMYGNGDDPDAAFVSAPTSGAAATPGPAPASGSDSRTAAESAPRSPGMKYKHYAPKGEMWLVQGDVAQQVATIQALVEKAQAEGLQVGVLTTEEHQAGYAADAVLSCGRRSDLATVASGLYAALREFDHLGIERIYAESYPDSGIGFAVMNRLRKAAGGRTIDAGVR